MVGRTVSHYRVLKLLGTGGMGTVYRRAGNHLRITAQLIDAERALELERNSEALFFLGMVLAETGVAVEARRYADEAVDRDSLMWMTAFGRFLVDLFDGQFESAVARCREWIARRDAPDPAWVLFWLGRALAYSGRRTKPGRRSSVRRGRPQACARTCASSAPAHSGRP